MEEPPVLSRQRMGGVRIWTMGKGTETESFYTISDSKSLWVVSENLMVA